MTVFFESTRAAGLERLHQFAPRMGRRYADGRNTDKAKYPKYTDGDQCSACTVFQTSVGENSGSCKWFPDKLVAATGWCSAYEIAI